MKTQLRNLIFILLAILMLPSESEAQRWKRRRYEMSLGVGASNFLGDLGGANQIGTHAFRDLEWTETRLAAAIGLRYKLSEYTALNSHLSYGQLAGDDALTKEPARNYRNLNFHSSLWEFNINFEAAFQREQIGHIYHLRKVSGQKAYELYTYGFAGLGFFHFNPKTEYQGQQVDLQPLHTEGVDYSLWGICIPIGIGFKYTVDQYWGVGLEFGVRKTFTDYIDDVSTSYIDPKILYESGGQMAVDLANRSTHKAPDSTLPGDQRGQPKYTDSYMFIIFSVNFKIRNTTNMLPRF